MPDHTRLRWSAFIGKKRIGPRTDHFDARQWWCRYGLLWLNFSPLTDVRSEISPETDTLLCGIEVHEILPQISGSQAGTPVEAAMLMPRDRFGMSSKSSEWQEQSRGSVLGSRSKAISSAAFPSLSGSVEVQEFPSEERDATNGPTLQLLGASREARGSSWRGGVMTQQASRGAALPPATPGSTASSAAFAGTGGSGSSGMSFVPKAGAVTKTPALVSTPTSPAGRQLARPQSVPSMASRKNSAQRHR